MLSTLTCIQKGTVQTQETEIDYNISGGSILSPNDSTDRNYDKKLLKARIEKLKGEVLSLKQLNKSLKPAKDIQALKAMVVNSIHLKNCIHMRKENLVENLENLSEAEDNKEALNSYLDEKIHKLLTKLSDPKLQELYNKSHPQYKIKDDQKKEQKKMSLDVLSYLMPRQRTVTQ